LNLLRILLKSSILFFRLIAYPALGFSLQDTQGQLKVSTLVLSLL
jgi:hypothetical protein